MEPKPNLSDLEVKEEANTTKGAILLAMGLQQLTGLSLEEIGNIFSHLNSQDAAAIAQTVGRAGMQGPAVKNVGKALKRG